jgi:hypothetical protein
MGCVYAYVIVLTLVGPERRNRNFEVEHDSDMVSLFPAPRKKDREAAFSLFVLR